jgi:hypothetical protein
MTEQRTDDGPDNVTLRYLREIRAEQEAAKDEALVLGARLGRIEAGIDVILAKIQAWTHAHRRLSERVAALEAGR